jgi:hypothetical protein
MKAKLSGIAIVWALLVSVASPESQAQYDGHITPGWAGRPASVAYIAQPLPSQDSEPGTATASDNLDCDGGGCQRHCTDSCRGDGCGRDCCCIPDWTFFGDFLYMRPRSAEVVYAVPYDGPAIPPPAVPVQIGPAGIVDPDYGPAFRTGFTRALGDCASVGVAYTYFDSSTSSEVSIAAPDIIRSMASHPSTWTASSDGLDASATYGVDFDLVDLDFRSVFSCSQRHTLNYLVGARYGGLVQGFRSQYAVNGVETVMTDIRFDGGGIRVGVEGERYARNSGLMLYGRGVASFLAGDFRARYAQGQAFDASVVDTSWRAGRIVPILDLEVGIGWTSCNGRRRLTAGYLVSAWYNTVKTNEWIQAVQANSFVGLGDTLTFDGLAVRAELRY